MMKLFKSIRQKLLTENKVSKYLLYAIGEIILVVIGILIALSINNWNEAKNQRDYLNSVYKIIQEDVEMNIKEISVFVDDYKDVRQAAFDTILASRLTRKKFDHNPDYHWVFGGYKDIRINTRGYDLFKNQASSLLTNDTLAYRIFEFYEKHLEEIEVAKIELYTEFKDNGKAFKNYDWATDHFLYGNPNGYFDYLTKNPEAIRRLSLYKLYYAIYVDELSNFKEDGQILVRKIDDRLKRK